jgi:DNA polymerase/3'-5' exonuclease PolX
MKHADALAMAEDVLNTLKPHCDRILIARSIRRQRPEVKDCELVAIPKHLPGGLFGDLPEVSPGFVAAVNQWPKVLGEPTGRYTQRLLSDDFKLDLFIADAENWGLILAMRTGSAMFSHEVLANTWVRLGYTSVKGRLTRGGQVIPIREETDLLALLKLPWVEPWAREV